MTVLADIDLEDPRRIALNRDLPYKYKDLAKQIPGAKWSNKDNCWKYPLGWATCLALRSTFGQELEIGPQLLEWSTKEYADRVYPCLSLRDATDAEGSDQLYPYQRAGVLFLSKARRALLADEMGTGKTRQSIMALQQLYMNGENPFPCLVVCPNSTKIGWKREAEAVWPGLTVTVVKGSAAQRRKQLEEPAHIYVMNWEQLRGHSRLAPYGSIALKKCVECGGTDERIKHTTCEVHPRELNEIEFKSVIADECFTAGTIVHTPLGERRIEDLQIGDEVWGFDHRTNKVRSSKILGTMSRESVSVVPEWNATPNHPYYVDGEGYRALGDLTPEDTCLAFTDRALPDLLPGVRAVRLEDWEQHKTDVLWSVVRWTGGGRPSAEESPTSNASAGRVRAMPAEVPAKEPLPTVLLEALLGNMDRFDSRDARALTTNDDLATRSTGCTGEARELLVFGSESIQVYEFGGTVGAREAAMAATGKWSTLDSSDSPSASALGAASWELAGSPSADGGRRDAAVLRPGHDILGRETRGRGGRLGSSRAEGLRRSTDAATGGPRMDRHPLLELRSPERYEQMCAAGARAEGETTTVYSLMTETGNYFADGLLVRNCHRSKDPKAKQTRALWAATGNAEFRFALSGTPIASAPDDLWTVLHWMSPEEWPSKTKYIDRFCDISYNAFGAATVIGIKQHMEKEFFGALDPRMRRMPKKLVLDFLPPVVMERRDVEMSPKQAKAYTQMRDQMIAELDNGDLLTTTSPLTRVMRLLQFASSYATLESRDNPKTQKVEEFARLTEPSCKIDAFLDDLEDFGDDSVVVFAVSRQLIELLSAKMEKKGIPHGLITGAQDGDERQRHMDDFQEGRTKFILCTIAAGGTGITLTRGRTAVFLQRSWSMIENYQAEARIHRIGSEQHDSVRIVDYVTAGTVEEVVIGAVERKSQQLEAILRDKDLLHKAIAGELSAEDQKAVEDRQHHHDDEKNEDPQ